MKFSLAVALLVSSFAPAASLSYLESISRAAPASTSFSQPATTDAPFFFTNGSKDEPASPSFSFMSEPAQPVISGSSGSYLDNLNTGSSTSGAGMRGYLDALAGPSSSLSGGAGMSGYLDSLPASMPVGGGAGITSYAESLNRAGSMSSSSYTPPASSAAPEAPASFAVGGNVATTSANYLDALTASSSNAISGGGMKNYLDFLPRAPVTSGGAGIPSYTSSLPTISSVRGPGMVSYTDNLSGGSSASASASGSAFVIGSIKGTFDFSLTLDENLKQQILDAGNRRVKLHGKVESVSY